MTNIRLHLDPQTFEQVKHIATRRRATVETLIQNLVRRLVAVEATADPFLGMFAQEPDLMDAVTAAAMGARGTDPLRLPLG
jgi:hypothetical protein